MKGYVDLHSHYLPGIDDGVRSFEEGVRLCTRLAAIGYDHVVATPHMRTAMFPNQRPELESLFNRFQQLTADVPGMPRTGLGAEHFFDDVFWERFMNDEIIPYPGGHAALVEFANERLPMRIDDFFFEMHLKGVRPVIAHPERYRPLFKTTTPIEGLIRGGALPLLDLMSLVGKYGRRPQRAAERMLSEGVYYAACSDAHRPDDVDTVDKAIERLHRLVGAEHSLMLLSENPGRILSGQVEA